MHSQAGSRSREAGDSLDVLVCVCMYTCVCLNVHRHVCVYSHVCVCVALGLNSESLICQANVPLMIYNPNHFDFETKSCYHVAQAMQHRLCGQDYWCAASSLVSWVVLLRPDRKTVKTTGTWGGKKLLKLRSHLFFLPTESQKHQHN